MAMMYLRLQAEGIWHFGAVKIILYKLKVLMVIDTLCFYAETLTCLQFAIKIRSLTFFLKFMGPCIVSIFQYMSNKMQLYTVYLYLETALHVSGGTATHHQERIQLYLQHLLFVTPLLLPVADSGR